MPLCEVIGVSADTREVGLQGLPAPMGYIPYWNNAPWQATIVLKTETQSSSIAAALRQAVWDVDAGVPVPGVTTFADVLKAAVAPNRFQTLLVGSFAICALLLASLGIYGVPAFAVARRTQELGIRLALGANPRALVGSVVRDGLAPVVAGLVLGLAGALAAGRLVQGLLYDVSASEPGAYASSSRSWPSWPSSRATCRPAASCGLTPCRHCGGNRTTMSLRLLTGRLRSLFGRTRRLRGFDADVEAHLSLLRGTSSARDSRPRRRGAKRGGGSVASIRPAKPSATRAVSPSSMRSPRMSATGCG